MRLTDFKPGRCPLWIKRPTSPGLQRVCARTTAEIPFYQPTKFRFIINIAHSRDNFAAFEKAGGQGKFFEFDMPPGQGHSLIGRLNLWSGPLDSYLSSLAAVGKD